MQAGCGHLCVCSAIAAAELSRMRDYLFPWPLALFLVRQVAEEAVSQQI